jgi:hypothetical protein
MILEAYRHGLSGVQTCGLRCEQVDFRMATLRVSPVK